MALLQYILCHFQLVNPGDDHIQWKIVHQQFCFQFLILHREQHLSDDQFFRLIAKIAVPGELPKTIGKLSDVLSRLLSGFEEIVHFERGGDLWRREVLIQCLDRQLIAAFSWNMFIRFELTDEFLDFGSAVERKCLQFVLGGFQLLPG